MIDEVDCLYVEIPGDSGYGAVHFAPGKWANQDGWDLDEEQIARVNSRSNRRLHRVLVRPFFDQRVATAQFRHELEHALQFNTDPGLYEFSFTCRELLYRTVETANPDRRGSGSMYNLLPDELDANKAAACLTLELFGEPTPGEAGGEHGILFRFATEPDRGTLPERMLAFALIFSESLSDVAHENRTTRDHLLSDLTPRLRSTWDELVSSDQIAEMRSSILDEAPSAEEISSADFPARAWDRLVDVARDAENQLRVRVATSLQEAQRRGGLP